MQHERSARDRFCHRQKVRRAPSRPRNHSSCIALGTIENWSMFSGMKWLVPMIRIPRFSASMVIPRPMLMCDWK